MITVAVQEKRFGGKQVLGRIDFTIAAGETLALVGPSGIGKSTLLRIIAGIDTDFVGEVQTPQPTAIVFQEPTLLPWRSALDNLLILHPTLHRSDAIGMLDRVGLGGQEDLYPRQLSLGQQRRLSLARAFVGKPAFLIMDEPFVSLDPENAQKMLALTERLIAQTEVATLFVTHAMDEAERLADKILNLNGTPAQIVQ